MAGSFESGDVITPAELNAAQTVFNRILVAGWLGWAVNNQQAAVQDLAGLISHSNRLTRCVREQGFGVTMPAPVIVE